MECSPRLGALGGPASPPATPVLAMSVSMSVPLAQRPLFVLALTLPVSSWGQPFLEHTYLYHLSRLDHRHNFSPYFLPIYLSLTGGDASVDSPWLSALLNVLRNPLASFLPQVSLVIIAGVALTRAVGIEAAMFFQTALFVAFNKVCTSQVS